MIKGFLLFALTAYAQDVSQQDVNHVVDAAHEHVERLETSVPNFICQERLISLLFMNGKMKKETTAHSVLTTTRDPNSRGSLFTESRAEMQINGKPSKRNEITGPFVWHGGPAYGDLHFLFNSGAGQDCLSWRLTGKVKLDDKDALLIETHATEDIRSNEACHDMRSDSGDKIWLQPESLNVMRIESRNPPTRRAFESDVTLTVDYLPVVFDGAEYWLPSHFISVLDFPGTPKRFHYEAFYSGYHKFEAQSVIHLDDVQ